MNATIRLALLAFSWLAPPEVLSRLSRQQLIMALDVLGKWSYIDCFVLILMMVAFRFHFVIPSADIDPNSTIGSLLPPGFLAIDVVVKPGWGIYGFMVSAMMSLTINHIVIMYHRTAMDWDEEVEDEEEDEENWAEIRVLRDEYLSLGESAAADAADREAALGGASFTGSMAVGARPYASTEGSDTMRGVVDGETTLENGGYRDFTEYVKSQRPSLAHYLDRDRAYSGHSDTSFGGSASPSRRSPRGSKQSRTPAGASQKTIETEHERAESTEGGRMGSGNHASELGNRSSRKATIVTQMRSDNERRARKHRNKWEALRNHVYEIKVPNMFKIRSTDPLFRRVERVKRKGSDEQHDNDNGNSQGHGKGSQRPLQRLSSDNGDKGEYAYLKMGYVRVTYFGQLLVFLILAVTTWLMIWGSVLTSFAFKFEGLAGLALGDLATGEYSLLSLGEFLFNLGKNPQTGEFEDAGVAFLWVLYMLFAFILPVLHMFMLGVLWAVPLTLSAQRGIFIAAEVCYPSRLLSPCLYFSWLPSYALSPLTITYHKMYHRFLTHGRHSRCSLCPSLPR